MTTGDGCLISGNDRRYMILWERSRSGDLDAQGIFYISLYDFLMILLERGQPGSVPVEIARDIRHEAADRIIWKLIQDPPETFNPARGTEAYAARSATRSASRGYERAVKHSRRHLFLDDTNIAEQVYYVMDPSPTPEQELLMKEEEAFLEEVGDIILDLIDKRLTDQQKIVFLSRVILDMSCGEIASNLKITENAVSKSFQRARRKLHKYLTSQGIACC